MMKLLIIDDEKKTRNGLQNHIDWAALDVGEVKTAANGEEAIILCTRYVPDIILSDIRMPGMDGIALCTYIKEQLPDCQIIFISGYADKEYLKAAIELDAVSYIEKPIDNKEVESAVKKAVARKEKLDHQLSEQNASSANMDKNLPLLRQWAVLTLIKDEELSSELLSSLKELQLFEQPNHYYRVMLIKCSRTWDNRLDYEERLLKFVDQVFADVEHAVAFKDVRHAVLILSSERQRELEAQTAPFTAMHQAVADWEWEGQRIFCAVGEQVQGITMVPQSYRSAVLALQKLFYAGYGSTSYYQGEYSFEPTFDNNLYNAFASCVERGDKEGTLAILNDVYACLRSQTKILNASVKNIYFKFGYRLVTSQENVAKGGLQHPDYKHYIWETFSDFDTLREIHEFLCQKATEALTRPEGNPVINKSIELIQKNYSDESLSVKTLALAAYLTPTYFANLFKKETGQTVKQYITNVRIEQAKRLLCDPKLKLYHVAVSVGYSDASYFAKTFKKVVGIMPSDYRDRNIV